MAGDKLSDQEERFCQEYIIDLKRGKAAERAGYSEKTASQSASRLLKRVKVLDRIEELKTERIERTKVDQDFVIERLKLLSDSNIGDFLKMPEKGQPFFDLSDATEDQLYAIEGLQVDTRYEGSGEDAEEVKRTKITLSGKRQSLELLGRHVGIFKDGSHDGPVIIILGDKREKKE